MIIPYKVKNPPGQFPWVTLSLIATNFVIYLLTSERALHVRQDVVSQYGLKWGVSPLITMLTSMFLHGDVWHIFSNMLYLWVFGPAVEGRLGKVGYLFLYLIAGVSGHVAQAALGSIGGSGNPVPTIGASGCVMGVLGAYWYLFSWSPVCMFYWVGWVWTGTIEIAAIWVISLYFVLDVLQGLIAKSMGVVGGIANFAHVGGALLGAVLVWSLGFKRDSASVSQAKAVHAEVKNIDLLTCEELEKLVVNFPENEELLVHYCRKSCEKGDCSGIRYALSANSYAVVTRCPEAALFYATHANDARSLLSAADLFYLGRYAESTKNLAQAIAVYERIERDHADSAEYEMSLYRLAKIYWLRFRRMNEARAKLERLLDVFPNGHLALEAEDMQREIDRYEHGAKAA